MASGPTTFNHGGIRPSLLATVLIVLVVSAGALHAQPVSSFYAFTSTTGTYTPIVGGSTWGTSTNDDTQYTGVSIGFTFYYTGIPFTTVSFTSNGWLCMGSTGSTTYTPISTGTLPYVVSAYGRDLQGQQITTPIVLTSELRTETIGTAPNRVFVLQWKDYRRYSTTYNGEQINMQIRLYETSNRIEVMYGYCNIIATNSVTGEVGLRGATSADYSNRSVVNGLNTWATSTAGTSNAATCEMTYLGLVPASGLTFRWEPLTFPTIVMLSTPPCFSPATDQTVTANITDVGGITESRIWFRKGTGTWYTALPTSVVGAVYTFIITPATFGGAVTGDQIWWYIAAKNTSGNVLTAPAGGTGTTTPIASSPPATPASYVIGASTNLPYTQTFDGHPTGVTFGGTLSSWRIGTPGGAIGPTAFSGTNALLAQNTANSYAVNENSWALLPPVNIPAAPAIPPVLSFYHKRDLESCCDGVNLMYSTDCGGTWTTLGTYLDPNGVNWYNNTGVYASGYNPVWNGQSYTSWIKAVVPIPASLYGLNGVLFRFGMYTDGSVQYSGMAIDDVVIKESPQKDIEVVDARIGYAPGTWAHIINAQHTVTAVIRNNGYEANPASVSLTCSINGLPMATESFSPAWAGSTATVTFVAKAVPTATGAMLLNVTSNYTGDQQATNNSYSRTYTIDNPKVFGDEPFVNVPVPAFNAGWTVVDNNAGVTWKTETAGAETYLVFPGGEAGNDWVFTPAAFLQAGSSYRVQFQYRSVSGTQVLDLAWGTAPNEASMNTFETFTFSNPSWVAAQSSVGPVAPYFNTPPTVPQNIYLGFRVRSGAVGALNIDNILLDENPTPPPKIGIGLPGTVQGQHLDNGLTPVQFSAIYKKSGLVARTYEVVSTTYSYGAPGDFLWDVSTSTPWIRLTKSSPAPTIFLPSNPYIPPRPRQLQTFTLTVDPSMLIPGTYAGSITLVASLYNGQYPAGLGATNEPLTIPVILSVIDPNAGSTPTGSQKACMTNLVVSAKPYVFKDVAGNPMAAVTVTSGAIPSMCIEMYSGQLPQGISRYRYVQRYFTINASGTWTADIDWYYADNEAAGGGVTRPDLLRPIRQPVAGGIWQDPVPGVTSTAYPQLNYVRGMGYSSTTIGGNHCLVTNWITPKEGNLPRAYEIGQNYPNPFNPTTAIDFAIPLAGHVQLVVINSLGEEVARLVDELRPAGVYTETFNAGTLPSGVYLYRLTAGSYTKTLPMTLAK